MNVNNFSAGPSALPAAVKERIREELPGWAAPGVSVMEVSHRGADFRRLAEGAEARLRRLMGLPDDYRVLFLQGGASTQFALIPMNFAQGRAAVYLTDGHWGAKACREARRLIDCAETGRGRQLEGSPAYVHATSNETVDGLQWRAAPETDAPVICDMSSDILSRPLDITEYACAYAGAQKNIGIAGLTLVIVHEALLGRCPDSLPTMLNYRALGESGSMANTPPTFAWYVCDLVLEWIESQGGLGAMGARNEEKARRLYAVIDASELYRNGIDGAERSAMNVVFETGSSELDVRFVQRAEEEGFIGLKGHRAVGGLRASIYNAVEPETVDALIQFMAEFERTA